MDFSLSIGLHIPPWLLPVLVSIAGGAGASAWWRIGAAHRRALRRDQSPIDGI
jgi:hypothetical protein